MDGLVFCWTLCFVPYRKYYLAGQSEVCFSFSSQLCFIELQNACLSSQYPLLALVSSTGNEGGVCVAFIPRVRSHFLRHMGFSVFFWSKTHKRPYPPTCIYKYQTATRALQYIYSLHRAGHNDIFYPIFCSFFFFLRANHHLLTWFHDWLTSLGGNCRFSLGHPQRGLGEHQYFPGR